MGGDYAVKRIDEMDAALYGSFKRARAERGVQSFGMQVIDLPPSFGGYPEPRPHSTTTRRKVFLALLCSGELEVDGERMPLDPDHIARVGPAAKRKVWSGPDGIRLLVLGGIPGRPTRRPRPARSAARSRNCS